MKEIEGEIADLSSKMEVLFDQIRAKNPSNGAALYLAGNFFPPTAIVADSSPEEKKLLDRYQRRRDTLFALKRLKASTPAASSPRAPSSP
jgi:hypothetical protein